MPDLITEKASIMWNSVLVLMNRKSKKRDEQVNSQEIDKLFVHYPNNLTIHKEKGMGDTLYFV